MSCGDIVFSRARHDYRTCSCNLVAIDGGRDYTKICGNANDFEIINLEVPLDNKVLYDSWNRGLKSIGILKNGKLKKGYVILNEPEDSEQNQKE